jgi:hypothetical protein
MNIKKLTNYTDFNINNKLNFSYLIINFILSVLNLIYIYLLSFYLNITFILFN